MRSFSQVRVLEYVQEEGAWKKKKENPRPKKEHAPSSLDGRQGDLGLGSNFGLQPRNRTKGDAKRWCSVGAQREETLALLTTHK